MNTKWILISIASLALVTLLAGSIAHAHGQADESHGMSRGMMGHMGMGGPQGMMRDNDTEDELKALDEQAKFLTETADLRLQIALKRIDLRKLWLAEEPDLGKVKAVSRELVDLRMKLYEKAPDKGIGHGMGMGHAVKRSMPTVLVGRPGEVLEVLPPDDRIALLPSQPRGRF